MTDSPSLDVINPSKNVLIRSLDTDSHDQAMAKIDCAHALFHDRSRHLLLHERISLLEKLVTALSDKQHQVVDIMIDEGGKPRQDSEVEFSRALNGIKLAITTISEHMGRKIPLGYQGGSVGRAASTSFFPRGVVLAFSAFNHPLNLIVHQVVPAFASGCPCVVKPASDTPLSCLALVETMHEVGIPHDYIQACVPRDLNIATAMVESNKIAFFSFIGSAKVGWMLRAKLKPGVRCALEHGGIAPCIVAASADLSAVIPSVIKGGFYHAGQVCVSTQRVYVDKRIFPEFMQKLEDGVSKLEVGDAQNVDTDVGPLIRAAEVDRVDEWVKEAVARGAECPVGGERLDGNFYAPTLLVNPPRDASVTNREIFGPVVCVYPYENLEEALALANSEEFAFQSAIYSQDIDEIYLAYERFDASAVMVNEHTAFRDDIMPFAGLKASGLSVGGIPYTIEDMQFEKMLVVKTSEQK